MGCWLMKSEPNCYSIEDLEREGRGMWEGCRNYTVRNYLRDAMSPGDLAFFYHSSCPEPGIVGEMRIVSDAYPDPTQFEPESRYYDAGSSTDNPRWYVRDVELVLRYSRAVSLNELRRTPGLESMAVLRKGQRLSITPVTHEEWAIVRSLALGGDALNGGAQGKQRTST